MTDDDAPPLAPDIQAILAQTTENLMRVAQLGTLYLEAAVGYKAQAIEAGFPEAEAARMAADYHALLLR